MGEVVVSTEDMEVMGETETGKVNREEVETGTDGAEYGKNGRGSNGAVMRWEKFLPRMMLRVLLVEADDSTRRIIAALLRKCSYRVAAVPDGLKAWEILRGRPHNVDLILTEVDLPSISGFALLTLIMEHEICKNIPVIMMSSQDSISTVYKCMMRGASDYLIKPIRRNELSNLWQHVWRRQSSAGGRNGLQDESVGQQKLGVASENDAASDNSSGYMASAQRNNEYVEKGSDAQSSCTRPDFEVESASIGNIHLSSQAKQGKSILLDQKLKKDEGCNQGNSPSIEAVAPQLDLSLSSPHGIEGRQTLRQSNASAFTRYIYKPLHHPQPRLIGACDQQQEQGTSTGKNIFSIPAGYNPGLPSTTADMQNRSLSLTLTTSQSNRCENPSAGHDFPLAVPVKIVSSSDQCSGRGSIFSPVFCTQSGPLTTPSPNSAASPSSHFQRNFLYHSNLENQYCDRPYDGMQQKALVSTEQQVGRQVDKVENEGHISQATDPSTGVSFSSSAVNLQSIGYGSACGSNSNVDQVAIARAAPEAQNEEAFFPQGGSSHRSNQREAALNKFRLKRKERCFEKKVRYESRKKLAEQRPRVKGQFVRQVHADCPPAEIG